jgi:hypothetical protein
MDKREARREMPSYCFILGAGFSRAYSEQAPLMSDFLKVAQRQGFYDPDHKHKELAQLASIYFGSALEANIETLASLLASKRERFPTVEPREAAYAHLVEIIRATLLDIYDQGLVC